MEISNSVANCRILSAETEGRFQFTVWPIKNISTKGLAIYSDEKISAGALAFLNIDLNVIFKTIGVIAKVIWAIKGKKGYDVGLNFSCWPKQKDEKLIFDFIKDKIACVLILNKDKEI